MENRKPMIVSSYLKHRSTLFGAAAAVVFLAGCAVPSQPRGLLQERVEEEEKDTPPAPFTFAVIGDTRPGRPVIPGDKASVSADYLKNIAGINRVAPDFTVLVGDMVRGYNTGQGDLLKLQWDEFDKAVARYDSPLYMVMGNHDVWDAYSMNTYRERYGVPYYSFDHKGSHFIALCSEIPGQVNRIVGEQLKWLKKDLEKAKDAKHKFVFLHKPLWVEGTDYSGRGEWMRNVQPLLGKYRVDAVFAGHEHYYEPFDVQGIPCFITGGGGAELGTWPKLGGFFHFLKVSVPVEGPPTIKVVKGGKEYSTGIVLKNFRRMVEGVRRALNSGGNWILDSGKSKRIVFHLDNTFKETMQLSLEWIGGPKRPVENVIAPQRCDIFLEPRLRKDLVFIASPVSDPGEVPTLRWKLYEQGEMIVQGTARLPIIRQGKYSTMDRGRTADIALDKPVQVAEGGKNWKGPDDCSAKVRVVKGKTGLLVLADVKDDVLLADSDNDNLNDHVEFFFDLRPKERKNANGYGKGVFRIVATPFFADGKSDGIDFHPAWTKVRGAMFRSSEIPGGYHVELFLPYEGLAAKHFKPGDEFNFDFAINDRDGKDAGPTLMFWSGDKRDRRVPTRFGILRASK